MGASINDNASHRDCVVAERTQSFTVDLQRNAMPIRLILFVLFLSGIGISSLIHAQDEEAEHYETIVHSVTSGDPRELAEPLMTLLPNRGDVVTMRERGLLILRVKPEQRDEVIELIEKLDQPKHSIRTQLFVLRATEALSDEDLGGLTGKLENVASHVKSLIESGKATLSNQTEITTLDQQKATLQVGARVAQVSGQAFTGARSVRSYETIQVGTIVNVIAKAANDVVTMDFDFEKSAVVPPDTEEGDDDDDEQITPGGVVTLTQQGSVGLSNGHARLIASMRERVASEDLATQYLVIGATIADGSELERSISIRSTSGGTAARAASPPSRSTPPGIAGVDERMKEVANRIFERYDRNGDGRLDTEEQQAARMRTQSRSAMTKDEFIQWLGRGRITGGFGDRRSGPPNSARRSAPPSGARRSTSD